MKPSAMQVIQAGARRAELELAQFGIAQAASVAPTVPVTEDWIAQTCRALMIGSHTSRDGWMV